MNNNLIINSLLTGMTGLLLVTTAQAGTPLWTFAQVSGYPPSITVSPVESKTVKYKIRNQSHKRHTLRMKPIKGITESGCTSPLEYHESCILSLSVHGSDLASNVASGPVLCEHGNPLQCYQPSKANSLNIIKGEATKFYVNGSKSTNGNGKSWRNAFNNLQSALDAATAHKGANEIWVATGVYKPSKVYSPQGVVNGACGSNCGLTFTPNLSLRTFNLPSNTAIYGGFSGNESSLKQRNGKQNPTILCGDLSSDCLTPYVPGTGDDRVWHVLMAGSDVPPGAGVQNVRLDTLIVRGGYANGPDQGVFEPPTNVLVSLDYEHAAGGGLLARYGSTIELNHMLFDQNGSDGSNASVGSSEPGGFHVLASGGGAVAAIDTDTLITINNAQFFNNRAVFTGAGGGALENLIDAAYMINSSQFGHNSADRNGGAIRAKDAGDVTILASEFRNNTVKSAFPDASGGAIGIINSNLSVSNSTLKENSTNPKGIGGGAIFFHIAFDDGTPYFLNVNNSRFVNNKGAAFGGGAINVFGIIPHVGSEANIRTSQFINNTGGTGGAIYLDSIPTLITRSDFHNNTAQLEGGAIFVSNYANVIVSPSFPLVTTQAHISDNEFTENAIVGTSATYAATLAAFNAIAFIFSGSSVNTMIPGGGAIAVVFDGKAKIFNNTFTRNTALNPLDANSGGAILVGGTSGSIPSMALAHACVSPNVYLENKANIDNDVAVYSPATVSACTFP